jgi:2-dehydro-3-deoxyglucarate aldolase
LDGHRSSSSRSTPFAERLRSGDTLFGTVVTLPSVAVAELVAEPLDFVWIDLEHGALDARDVAPLAIAARAAGTAALARLPNADPPTLAAILDAGIDGVVAPRVESAREAKRLVERLRYPPDGRRGAAVRRAQRYGRADGGQEGDCRSSEPLCLAQIESAAGVAAAAEIAAVDGVDALVVGCADLAQTVDGSLPEAIEAVQQAARGGGVASGIAGPDDPELLLELAARESTVLVCSADVRLFARAVDAVAEELHRVRA